MHMRRIEHFAASRFPRSLRARARAFASLCGARPPNETCKCSPKRPHNYIRHTRADGCSVVVAAATCAPLRMYFFFFLYTLMMPVHTERFKIESNMTRRPFWGICSEHSTQPSESTRNRRATRMLHESRQHNPTKKNTFKTHANRKDRRRQMHTRALRIFTALDNIDRKLPREYARARRQ